MSIFTQEDVGCSSQVLDYLALRQRVVASNVANVNTPGYKTRDISFENVLKSKEGGLQIELTRTHEKHFPKALEDEGGIETFLAYGPINAQDGINDVDLDKEMLKVGEIQTNLNIFSEFIIRKYRQWKNVISGTV